MTTRLGAPIILLMNYEQAIAYFGTAANLARSLGVKPPSVSEWKNAIPEGRQYQIEQATNGALRADRPALRVSKEKNAA